MTCVVPWAYSYAHLSAPEFHELSWLLGSHITRWIITGLRLVQFVIVSRWPSTWTPRGRLVMGTSGTKLMLESCDQRRRKMST
jgi:hypothetical protein